MDINIYSVLRYNFTRMCLFGPAKRATPIFDTDTKIKIANDFSLQLF